MANRMIHTPGTWISVATLQEYWTSITATWAITSGWYVRSTSAPELHKTFDTQTGFTIGFKFKYGGTNVANILEIWDGSAAKHLALEFNGVTGRFNVLRNTVNIQSGVTVLAINTEYYVEWKFTIADSGGVSILHIDAVTDTGINSSSLDTRNASNASADNIIFIANNLNAPQFRDIYVNDNSGGVDDDFWGPITVAVLGASSAGNKSQWTPLASTNVSNVDDATPDGDTSYNATSTNGQIDSFVMTDTGYSAGTVKGVEVVEELRRTDASATSRVAPLWRIGSTDYASATDFVPTSSYLLQSQRYRQSPATAAAWTVSELDGAELGYKRTAA